MGVFGQLLPSMVPRLFPTFHKVGPKAAHSGILLVPNKNVPTGRFRGQGVLFVGLEEHAGRRQVE